jgi:hypothetical protein
LLADCEPLGDVMQTLSGKTLAAASATFSPSQMTTGASQRAVSLSRLKKRARRRKHLPAPAQARRITPERQGKELLALAWRIEPQDAKERCAALAR